MSIEDNKAIIGRWFTEFWGPDFNPAVIDELAHPDIRFEYSLHQPVRGREGVKQFAAAFRASFPDLAFGGTADLIAEGDYVVGQWIGGGTHTGAPMADLPLGGLLQANTGKTMRFTGTSVLKVKDGLIVEEIGLDDGVSVLNQLGPSPRAETTRKPWAWARTVPGHGRLHSRPATSLLGPSIRSRVSARLVLPL